MLVIGLVAKYDSKTNNSMYSLILVLSLRHNLHFQCLFGLQQHVLYSFLILFFSFRYNFKILMLKCHLWSYDVHILYTSLGDSNSGDHGNSQENLVKQFQSLITPLLFIAFIFSSVLFGPRDQNQVRSFSTISAMSLLVSSRCVGCIKLLRLVN